jgi:predicted acylesterase/phospholipase RssA
MPAPDAGRPGPAGEHPRTGLTLSGGGFRATLFHLGVVRFLYEERLLHKITHVCSVSGGSILAANLVLNWERYTSEKADDFDAVARELIGFIRSDLRGRVEREWLFSWAALGLPRLWKGRWWRTTLLQRGYDRLYRGARLRDLVAGERPQLHLLATSFSTGHLVAFGNSEMRFCGDPVPDPEAMPADEVPVALAVTASSAFPPLFPPVRVDHATFGASRGVFPNRHYLTDGGVFDNLGVHRLLLLFKPEERLDLVVVSDAQRSLEREYGSEYNMTLGRTARCVDLMMDRVSWFESTAARDVITRVKGRLLYCGLPKRAADALKAAYAPSPPEQFEVASTRTDLDVFTDDEIDAIVHQGFAAARAAAEAGGLCGPWLADRTVWHPARPDRGPGYRLQGIDRRKWGLFRPSHWASWALWGLLTLWAAVPIGLYLIQYSRAVAAEKRFVDQSQAVERAAKDLQAVRALGEVVLARKTLHEPLKEGFDAKSQEEWRKSSYEARMEELKQLASKVRQDATFPAPTTFDSLLAEVLMPPEEKHPFSNEDGIRNLAKQIRGKMQAQGGKVFIEYQTDRRAQLYDEVLEAAEQIAVPDKLRLDQVANSRRQFWRHYWGSMALVEGDGVEKAMASFAQVLRQWEQRGKAATRAEKERLKALVSQLRDACLMELRGK